MEDTPYLTPVETHQRYAKSANLYARKLLPSDVDRDFVFSDFKTLHLAVTYTV